MENKDVQNGNEQYAFLLFLISMFGKNDIAGDTSRTNRAMDLQICPNLVGCHSHNFSLFVQDKT